MLNIEKLYHVEYRQLVKYTTNFIRCKGAIISIIEKGRNM